jgi:hypothetical protein
MPQTSAREHAGKVFAKQIHVGEAGGLTVAGVVVGPAVGGQVVVTGSATFTVPLGAIASVVATLDASAALTGSTVTASWTGTAVTLTVTEPTSSSNPTPAPSTTATLVNWIALGS